MQEDRRHREWGVSNVDDIVVLFSTLQELRYCTLNLQKIRRVWWLVYSYRGRCFFSVCLPVRGDCLCRILRPGQPCLLSS